MEWSFRPMVVADLPALLIVQERSAVAGLAKVFPQETYPFPREAIRARWRDELADPAIAAYVATEKDGALTGFAARRADEILHFGTAVETWGTGLAAELYDALVATFPVGVDRIWLRVFAENHRGRRFWEKLGWSSTGRESRTSYPPHPMLIEYEKRRSGDA